MRMRLVLPVVVLLGAGGFALTPWAQLARQTVATVIAKRLAAPELQQGHAEGSARAANRTRKRSGQAPFDLGQVAPDERGDWPKPDPAALEALDQERPAPDDGAGDTVVVAHQGAVAAFDYELPGSDVDPERSLVAIGREVFVRAAPSYRARKIGYLRTGAILRRSEKPVGYKACPQGWYSVEPEGYVCVGKYASLDVTHPLAIATARRANRKAALPYEYGISRFPTPPFYTKVPSPKEQRRVEHDLARHLTHGTAKAWKDAPRGPIPELLANGQPSYTWGGGRHSPRSIYTGRGLPQSGFAMLSLFESEGRAFGFSVDLDVMPLDRMKRVVPSKFRGVAIDAQTPLPVVFVRSRAAFLLQGDLRKGLEAERRLRFREAIAITGKAVRVGGVRYLEVRGGGYLRDENLVRVNPMKKRPGWAKPGRTWLSISILKQTLVAYEGVTPVYATLVSTGAAGLGDPKKTHSTVRGQFLVHTKHVTATMSGDEVGDEFDLRDVPYVQYFTEGYALHAAYWHDSFGKPRSHGCINLSPLDANWLFHWTDPPVPDSWHGAMTLRQGTLVHVHP